METMAMTMNTPPEILKKANRKLFYMSLWVLFCIIFFVYHSFAAFYSTNACYIETERERNKLENKNRM